MPGCNIADMSTDQKPKSFSISGVSYTATHLDPFVAMDLLRDLGLILSPIAGSLGGAVVADKKLMAAIRDKADKKKKLQEIIDGGNDESGGAAWGSAIESAASGFFDNFTKEFQRELFNTFAEVTMVRVKDNDLLLKDIMSVHFRGKLPDMYQWLFTMLKFEFGDFIAGIAPLIRSAVQ